MKIMNFSGLLAVVTTLGAFQSAHATDWSQPPLLCVEDVVPAPPKRPCPDLTTVVDPMKDDPVLPEAELKWWKDQKFALGYCRSAEVARRERLAPGSMTPGYLQIAYLRSRAVQNHDEKVRAVYDAAETYAVPPHILTGALMQESIFSNLGISDDGGNYSCGIAQINLPEWCSFAESQTPAEKRAMGWPTSGVDCAVHGSKDLIQPFYEIGLKRLNGLPTYRIEPQHTQNIRFKDVKNKWTPATPAVNALRYQTATSFLNNCGVIATAMKAKAFVLRRNYNAYIPKGLKEYETYRPGERFNLNCMRPLTAPTYPVQTAWVMAVGTYNAGGRVADVMASTLGWNREQVSSSQTFATFNPDYRPVPGFTIQDLISSVFHAGKYNPLTDKMSFTSLSGTPLEMRWFKLCVLQRHMARIVQHVTRGDIPSLVTTLEGTRGCQKDAGDPDPR